MINVKVLADQFTTVTINESKNENCIAEYTISKTAINLHAKREGLEVSKIVHVFHPLTGLNELKELTNFIKIPMLVPLITMTELYHNAIDHSPKEVMAWGHVSNEYGWTFAYPNQLQTTGSVEPINKFDPLSEGAVIDFHSHGLHPAIFSSADDEEQTAFRIYTVIGNLDEARPQICTRICVLNHRFYIPSCVVYELPDYFEDVCTP